MNTKNLLARRRQSGAAAIEFALVFVPFFAVLYATITYGFTFLLLNSFKSAAEEAARFTARIEEVADAPALKAHLQAVVLSEDGTSGELSWLPSLLKDKVKVTVEGPDPADGKLTVGVSYPGYAQSPPLPLLRLPGVGAVPPLPEDLSASAVIYLSRPLLAGAR